MQDTGDTVPAMKPTEARISPELVREASNFLGASALARVKYPNFIGAGSGRCGTSHLFGLLASHPDFYLSPLKEVNFFGIRQSPFNKDGWTLSDYKFCFASQESQRYVGEISPVYLAQTVSLRQIQAQLGKIKILVTMRNPLDRFISQYSFHRKLHKFDDLNSYASAALDSYLPGYFRLNWHSPEKAIELSLYAAGLSACLDLFGPHNVLVLVYEDLVQSERIWKKSLSEFFDVDLMSAKSPAQLRNASEAAAMDELTPENYSRLRHLFRADAEKLSAPMNRDMLGLWGLA
jgi:hypothetical protein